MPVRVGVVVAGMPLPDPRIFFTEPKIKEVQTFVKKTEDLVVNTLEALGIISTSPVKSN